MPKSKQDMLVNGFAHLLEAHDLLESVYLEYTDEIPPELRDKLQKYFEFDDGE